MQDQCSVHCRSFVGGSDPRIITGHDETGLARLGREKRGEVGLEDPSRMAPTPDRAKIHVEPVQAAHAEFVAALAERPPRPIPLSPHALDFQDRLEQLREVLTALSAYLTAMLEDAAQNVPGGLDLRQIDALLADLVSDVTGTLRNAAEAISGRAA